MHGLPGAIFLAEHMPMIEVPGEFWSEDVAEQGRLALVACPCGATPGATLLGRPVSCDCGRVYMFTGRDVLVYGSPQHAT